MEPAVVLYDSDCGFCRWSLAKLLAWDGRGSLRPVAIQSREAESLLAGMDEAERMASWHLVSAEGDVWSAGAALEPLLRLLPGGRPLAAIAAWAPRLSARGYRWVAERRGTFGRLLTAGARRRADERIDARGLDMRGGSVRSHPFSG
jgi:predicted DCC family thiol-disulfide oxidoreductase YuxK